MCGMTSIFCFKPITASKITDLNKFVMDAVYTGSLRGRDSTGIMYLPRTYTVTSPSVFKKAVDGAVFADMYNAKKALQDCELYAFTVIHNRKATHGGISDNTAHPFQVEHITLVHNGTLNNHRALPRGSESSVDSKAVACALNTVEPDNAVEILAQLSGAYVLIWHDTRDNSINIAKNPQRPWSAAFIEGEQVLLGASEGKMLQWLADRNDLKLGKVFSPKDHVHYKWLLEEKDVKNYYYTEYQPPTTANVYNPYSYSYDRTYDDKAAQGRLARFTELEKLGFKRGDKVEFETYEYGTYSGSSTKGILKGIDCTYSFDVEAYNIDSSLYDAGKKLVGTISYVKDTAAFPQWMTVVVDDVKESTGEHTVKKPTPLVIVGEKSTEREIAEMMQKESTEERLVVGPGGVLIPLREYNERTKDGCGNCSCDLSDPESVEWTFMEDPLCPECAKDLCDIAAIGHC